MRNCFVGLATVKPPADRGRWRVRPDIHTSFVTDVPETADLILKTACHRTEYRAALVHLIGCGLSRYEAPFPTTVGRAVRESDLWAVVCYDARETGYPAGPFVLYGRHRHWKNIVPPDAVPREPLPPDDSTGRCGFVPRDALEIGLAGLFTFATVSADLRF